MRISRGESYAESVRQNDVNVVILKSGNDLNKKQFRDYRGTFNPENSKFKAQFFS